MQAQIRDQSDNPKQKRHGLRTPSSNRSLATRSLVTLPFVGFKIRFDSAKHLPELGCRQSCQVFDPPVMRAQEGFSYHLFPPLCCAWSAFQQTCKNDTTKTINCESTLEKNLDFWLFLPYVEADFAPEARRSQHRADGEKEAGR
jgi:hypothetical protein